MKAHEKGYCCELEIDSSGFVHICAKKLNHDDRHSCACGRSMLDKLCCGSCFLLKEKCECVQ